MTVCTQVGKRAYFIARALNTVNLVAVEVMVQIIHVNKETGLVTENHKSQTRNQLYLKASIHT